MTESRERDKRGRFVRGNTLARAGGQARAAKLTPRRRKAIARLARRRMVERHFGGDDRRSPLRTAVRHPGPIQDWRAKKLTFSLFDAINQDVVF